MRVDNPVIDAHQVLGEHLLPGLAYIDLLFQIARKQGYDASSLELRNLSLYEPLIVSRRAPVVLDFEFSGDASTGWKIAVDGAEFGSDARRRYATAEMRVIAPVAFDEVIDLNAMRRLPEIDNDALYAACAKRELRHGAFLRQSGRTYRDGADIYVECHLHETARATAASFMFHPALIDGSAVCAGGVVAAIHENEQRELALPLFFEAFRAGELLQQSCIARLRGGSLRKVGELNYYTLEFFTLAGRKVAELTNFATKLVRGGGLGASHTPEAGASTAVSTADAAALSDHEMSGVEIEQLLRSLIAERTHQPIAGIDAAAGYYELGLDSRGLLEIVATLERSLGVTLSPTLLFEHATIAQLAQYLLAQRVRRKSSSTPVARDRVESAQAAIIENVSKPAAEQPPVLDDVAIIGIAGRFPGAKNVREFWTNLVAGRDCVTEIPASRWNWREFASQSSPSGKPLSRWGGFVADVERFDAQFFRISPREAALLDPQERLYLETCWEAMEDAGYRPATLVQGASARRPVGVFVGVMQKDYALVAKDAGGRTAALSQSNASIANRVSYFCNFSGPSMAVDTVCSSSLVAVHLAVQSLRNRECEVALAGGVNLALHPAKYLAYGMLDMHASDGRCRTFGAGGDGYVPAEAVGAVLLKPLARAVADGDHVYAVIRSSGTNHAGTTSGFTVPSPVGQGELIANCLERARIDPRTVSYVEAHGTGTSLGDPIEIEGLAKAFGAHSGEPYCAIGSVKSNMGHAEAAAGICGLIKLALQFEHATLVPSLHSETLNPHIDWSRTPFVVQSATQPWKPAQTEHQGLILSSPRRAAISSFGANGSNAHLILEELAEGEANVGAAPEGAVLVPMSAASEAQLLEYAGALASHLASAACDSVPLSDVAYTFQVGREAMQSRAAFVASTREQLIEQLQSFTRSQDAVGVFRTRDRAAIDISADAVRESLVTRDLDRLASAWIAGSAIEWPNLHRERRPRRISLPTYPFARDAFWIGARRTSAPAHVDTPVISAAQPAAQDIMESRLSSSKRPAIALRALSSANVVGSQVVTRKPITLASVGVEVEIDAVPAARTPTSTPTPMPAIENAPTAVQPSVSATDIAGTLTKTLADALYLEPSRIDAQRPFVEMGLDSIVGVEWVRTINKAYGLSMPTTKIYDHPTIEQLAQYLVTLVSAALPKQSTPSLPTPQAAASAPTTEASAQAQPAVDVAQLEAELTRTLADALYMDATRIDRERPFVELGLDSIVGVEWTRTINKLLGLTLPTTKLYDHPTIAQLAAYFAGIVAPRAERSVNTTPARAATRAEEKQLPAKPKTSVAPARLSVPRDQPFGLVLTTVSSLEELALSEWRVPDPDAHEVTVEVRASALNFPDVMCIRGLYPTMPSYPFVPGFEIAGVITKVGRAVTAFKVGDAVLGVTGPQMGGHASHVTVSATNLVAKPASLSFEEACCIPVVFATVDHAFQVGHVARGESVLIQTATGGCGLAAIQLARLRGATCYGTSSREEKRAILHRVGLEHVFDYKRDAFDVELRRLTDGRGVDVVLNMLSGEAIQRGLNSLAPFGRYLEIAVHALRTSDKLDLSGLVNNQSIHSIDLRRMAAERGSDWSQTLQPLVALFEAGLLAPIVSRVYPLDQLGAALECVADGQHIGKIVISHAQTSVVDCTASCIERLSEQRDRAAAHARASGVTTAVAARPAQATDDAIAVIGASGAFPGAKDLTLFWDNIAAGKDSVGEIPSDRWPLDRYFDSAGAKNKSACKWMGCLDDIACFDPLFFNISPAEAEWMDPQQRLFLEHSWRCIEDAGLDPQALSGTRCGVYVGCANSDYGASYGRELTAQALLGNASSILAARIAYVLNLRGPCLAIDTACSSSLVAIAEACDSLISRRSDVAIAGGVSIMTAPDLLVMASKAGMLSKTGRCYTFDARADGFVPAEGVGVLLLKRLRDAVRDGDNIQCVIRGWGINHDGRTNGITAPSASSQTLLEREVYDRFGISPESITMVEAHGTGTQLGDPIEVAALTDAFRAYTPREAFCALGSVKSNVGHALAAAGAAGFIKAMLSLRHRMLPPTIQFERLNDHVMLDGGPFYINATLKPWEGEQGPRRAAVSSFGFSGTNVHVVLEEPPARYIREASARVPAPVSLFVLSGKSEARLADQARQLATFLERQTDSSIADVAYTLQTGRSAFDWRLAFVAASRQEAIAILGSYLAERTGGACVAGRVDRTVGQRTLDANELQQGSRDRVTLGSIASAWVQGAGVDWRQLHAGQERQRVSVPTYPFARERYWLDQPTETTPAAVPQVEAQPVSQTVDRAARLLARRWVPSPAPAALGPTLDAHVVLLAPALGGAIDALVGAKIEGHVLPETEVDVSSMTQQVLAQTAALLRRSGTQQVLLQVVIRSEGTAALAGALAALLKTAHHENPRFVGQLIELPTTFAAADVLRVVQENAASTDVDVRYRAGRETAVLTDIEALAPSLPWKDSGVYLITGGVGGIGIEIAREILARVRGARLVLAGRTPTNSAIETLIDDLRRVNDSAHVDYRSLDVTNELEVQRCVAEIRARYGELSGIIHSAGLNRDAFILQQQASIVREVLAPKVLGTIHLDRATADVPLDFLLLFSSVAGVFGNAGQSDYATANAFLDRYASYRRELAACGQRHGRTLSVAWPLWEHGGMRVDPALREHMERQGFSTLSTRAGMDALYRAFASGESAVVALCGQEEAIEALIRPRSIETARATTPVATAGVDDDTLRSRTMRQLKALIGGVIKIDSARLEESEALQYYGVDSILIVQLNDKLAAVFGPLQKTLFFEYPSLAELRDHLVSAHRAQCLEWTGLSASARTGTEQSSPQRQEERKSAARPVITSAAAQPQREDIAIVAMTGRYPGASDLRVLWDNLQVARDCISEMSASDGDTSPARWAGFLDNTTTFDPLFFGIAPRDARAMDPQELLFLETAWELLEGCGYTREGLRSCTDGKVSVYIGASHHGAHAAEQASDVGPSMRSHGSIANRVSHLLGVTGASVAVDSMCSSSASALHLACADLLRGDSNASIAGGVNLLSTPGKFPVLQQAGLLASRPDSRAFADGDGYLPAEAVGAVLLKRLADAKAHGDEILAVIKSTAMAHGGGANAYAVPNPSLQAEVIRSALARAAIDPGTIGYIEAAANGSALGDAIEITALQQVFAEHGSGPRAIGSVKALIGHAEAASTMSQLAKVVLQLQHRQLAPTPLPEALNPNLGLREEVLVLHSEKADWPLPSGASGVCTPRRALIDSYGAGGSYAAIVLEEYGDGLAPENPARDQRMGEHVIVLSAQDDERLQCVARRLRDRLLQAPATDLEQLAYTLQTAREAMHARVAWVVNTTEELMRALDAYVGDATADAHASVAMYRGEANADSSLRALLSGATGDALTHALIEHRDSEKMAMLWAQGAAIPWRSLYEGLDLRPLPLPTYPFRREALPRDGAPQSAVAQRLPHAFDGARHAVERFVIDFLATELGVDARRIDLKRRFREYGADSLTTRRLLRAIAEKFQIVIAGRQLADASSIGALLESLTQLQAIAADDIEDGAQLGALPDVPERLTTASELGDFQTRVLRGFMEGAIDYTEMDKLIEQGSLV
jgi:polyketide synthase PksN